ncbi:MULTISPECIES: hypothetical protein [unclassified Mesobacillus]|uniref:hypothetical protein n=1 Tax=unclassified Mesobacillus TaxID=2675270 RepID=UPI00203C9609|nr:MULTISPECIES: hypothetical protein [unclassified Mesobacillus]MCM3126034.1 hypothetical protein [Mesobacillus sp. MER 33]MCM3236020.1 hypothetical protein [Mesobacillus sp. MER 48]
MNSLLNKVVASFIALTMIFNVVGYTGSAIVGLESVEAAGYPPRKKTKDPFFLTFSGLAAMWIASEVAGMVVQEAAKNGIQTACNKYKKYSGVTRTCTFIGFKPK